MSNEVDLRCLNCGWNGTRSELTPLGSVGRLHCPVCHAEYGTRDGVPAAGADVGLLPEDSRFFMKPSLDLSLFHLDRDLAGLIEYRQERMFDFEDPPTEEELKSLDGEIKRYLEALPKKVAGVAAVVRNWRSQRGNARREIDRLKAIVAHLDAMEARLLECCGEVLEHQPEPKKGCRKLVGADGSTISLKGNGGVQALDVYDPSMVPDDLCRMEGWINADLLKDLLDMEQGLPMPSVVKSLQFDFTRVVYGPAVRQNLERPCQMCGGVPPLTEDVPECGSCGGSGKQGVPGARLLERGKHVEIR